jgi:molybdate transport system regulatory protein
VHANPAVFSFALQAWRAFLTMPHTHLSICLELNNRNRIGPSKIALLEAIQAKGSITAAAQHLGMSYRRAWLLVRQINDALHQPAIAIPRGGTVVTPVGRRVINLYHSIENLTRAAAFQELQEIARLTRRRRQIAKRGPAKRANGPEEP